MHASCGSSVNHKSAGSGKKNRKLKDILDELEFNQVITFVRSTQRCQELDNLLRKCNFPSTTVHSGIKQEERINRCTRVPLIEGQAYDKERISRDVLFPVDLVRGNVTPRTAYREYWWLNTGRGFLGVPRTGWSPVETS
ncbi:Suppressor of the cold-sensitive snRNP biogenesis mutant brr1-1 [Epicoccum nigrum]|nr:Suppressor of the cold-sensitive snRNP biogenesis mutant brr1-1 [Epicoccum nigrum]